MRTNIIILTVLLLNGCCTKKNCVDNIGLNIHVILKNFTADELVKTKLFAYDMATKAPINTYTSNFVQLNADGGSFEINSADKNKEMRDQFFVIQTPASSDTIYNITYELYTQKIKCNSCFPFGSEKINVTKFRYFSFFYKGQQFFTDSLTIAK